MYEYGMGLISVVQVKIETEQMAFCIVCLQSECHIQSVPEIHM